MENLQSRLQTMEKTIQSIANIGSSFQSLNDKVNHILASFNFFQHKNNKVAQLGQPPHTPVQNQTQLHFLQPNANEQAASVVFHNPHSIPMFMENFPGETAPIYKPL